MVITIGPCGYGGVGDIHEHYRSVSVSGGRGAAYLTRGMYEEAKATALKYENCFGKGNFFLELQDHGIPEQAQVNQQLLRMHQELGIDLVATNDVHYTYEKDAEAHDILLCLQTGKKLSDETVCVMRRPVFCKIRRGDEALFLMHWMPSRIHRRSQTAVMWKSNSV